MRTLRFYGVSDDLVEIEGGIQDEPDEIGSYDAEAVLRVADKAGNGLHVHVNYAHGGPAGCWMVGISQLDEDVPLPAWPMRWGIGGRGYSVQLELDVPDRVRVTEMPRGDES